MSVIESWVDGACEPKNPGGHIGWGVIIRCGKDTESVSGSLPASPANSNNVAEYLAVCEVFKQVEDEPGSLIIYSDSRMIVNQLEGREKIVKGLYLPYYYLARKLMVERRIKYGPLGHVVTLKWIPREQNQKADWLSKRKLRERGLICEGG
jgi:ribonuclease HI